MKRILIIMLGVCLVALTGCGDSSQSVENRDYVVAMSVSSETSGYEISLEIADLTDYKGYGAGTMPVRECSYKAASLVDVMQAYFDENGRRLDVAHINSITLNGEQGLYDELIIELAGLPYISKSITVKYGNAREMVLREMIRQTLSIQSEKSLLHCE